MVSALKQTPCSIPWGLRNRTHWSARYTNGRDAAQQESLFELYKFNPLSPHCRSIARELVHCYTWGRLRIVTVRGNTVGCQPHTYSLLKNQRWQPHWLPQLMSLPGQSRDWWRTRDWTLGQPTENKIDRKPNFLKIFYFIKSETSDSFANHFDGHFAYLKTLDFYFKSLGWFYFQCILSSQWKAVTVNLRILHC